LERRSKALLFKGELIYLERDSRFRWIVHENFLSKLLAISSEEIKKIREEHSGKLVENSEFTIREIVEFSSDKPIKTLFWTRRGVIKLAYLIKSSNIFDVVDFLEEIEFEDEREPIFSEIEEVLNSKLETIKQDSSFRDIEEFITTFSKFIREKEYIKLKKESSFKSFLLDFFDEALKGVKQR
jgi:hypothetical protein